jgi:hypothetical protein
VVSKYHSAGLADTPKHIEVVRRRYSGFDSEHQNFTTMNINNFINQNPKHTLVFTKNEPDGFIFTDLGFEMAPLLEGQSLPSVVASETFESVAVKGMQVHPEYGKYWAIKNIGILFEPSLRLNVRLLFESISHGTLLVVCSDGIVLNDTFHFIKPTDGFGISLSGLSFLVIE